MLRVDVQYLDEPSHSVRLTLAEKHRRTRACGVLVKSFLKSFREKHGAGLDDAAPRLALRRARDGAILDRDALIGDALEDGEGRVHRLVSAVLARPARRVVWMLVARAQPCVLGAA